MVNLHRGEIDMVLDGRRRTLVLTLGALAELEAAFGATDLVALAERFERGRLSAADAVRVLAAGLRGAGESVSDAEVAAMRAEEGALGYARAVSALLVATFGTAPAGEGAALPPAGPQTA
ncbi:MAG: transfer Agent [Rhizobiales bacterium 32-66-8]|nr:MAG: transfer Agent [Rhizobiales bacterium 32-66-8]